MNLKTLRQSLASALEDAGIDYSTSAFPPPVVVLPTVVIVPGNPWIAPVTLGRPGTPQVEVSFRLTCIVANLDNQGSLDQLETLVFAVLVGTREETRRQRRESFAKTELFEKLRRVVEAKFIECLGHAHLAHFAQR